MSRYSCGRPGPKRNIDKVKIKCKLPTLTQFHSGKDIDSYPAVMATMSLKCHILCVVAALATHGTLVDAWFMK